MSRTVSVPVRSKSQKLQVGVKEENMVKSTVRSILVIMGYGIRMCRR